MSSVRQVRILPTENLRFPEEGSSTQGKSAGSILRRYGEGNYSTEAADFTLSRKAASEIVGARTVNRHR